jgi:hypothetical protein
MSHLLGCLNSQHPLCDASELWWWDIIERGGKKRRSLQNRKLNLTTVVYLRWTSLMKCCGGMKDRSMSTRAITIFLESRRYSSNAALAIATTCENIISQKQFRNFCVNIFYDTKKQTSKN